MDPFNQFFEKVGAFIVRRLDTAPELLLYTLRYEPEAALQITGGGIHDEELPEAALQREVYEETGYDSLRLIRKIGVSETSLLFRPLQRHCFLLDGTGLPESWVHTVTGDGLDQGERFHFSWYRVDAGPVLGGDHGYFLNPEAIPELFPTRAAFVT